ncbi:AAA family ATPase [Algicella marina]|uniref:AAA family ATPase n=1 Tax=Algicella marina TaxID=2683284 RepID=A0A6P1T6B5_9RHOB|nr:AAA family ATPase [Algicella marina]QHQ37230.1 AAA family ATPase [Algicella marina]
MGLLKAKPEEVEVFAIARNHDEFQDMTVSLNAEIAGRWAPLELDKGEATIKAGVGPDLEIAIVAVSSEDERNLAPVTKLIQTARDHGIKVLLLAKDLSPSGLHQLLRVGADDFTPYPMPDGALADAISRLRGSFEAAPKDAAADKKRNRRGIIMPVYGVAGGVGSTTFAVNIAWELALLSKKTDKRVCLLDFNFQFGSVSTYLDLPRREAIYELISDADGIDHDSLSQALTSYKTRLAVLTAPMDALPLDIIAPEDITKLLEIAQSSYDFVVVDMPQALVHWSDNVLRMSETFFAVMEIDMRSAQNCLRFLRALKAEDLPYEKVQFALNRAPGFTDINGKARAKRLAESLGVEINIMLPDGGKAVLSSGDEGTPLAESAPKNALRKEFKSIAQSIFDAMVADKAAVVQ